MRAVAAALLLTACGGSGYFRPDLTVGPGIRVDLGGQPRDGIESYLLACSWIVGAGVVGADVKFLSDARTVGEDCGEARELAGCYRLDGDLILVAQAPTLGATALCHELAHRAVVLAGGGLDLAHRSPLFPLADRVGK